MTVKEYECKSVLLAVEFYGKEINAFTAGDGSCDPHSAANQL